MSKTAVVILNWNTRDYLRRFLPSILESIEGMDADIVVADSGSTDDSLEVLAKEFPTVIRIPLGENLGFTGGYNKAFDLLEADTRYDYFVLINSDIEVRKNWLFPLVKYMDENPSCGACSPKLHSLDRKDFFEYAGAAGGFIDRMGYPYCRGRILSHVEKDDGQYDNCPCDVMWATGACLLVRSDLYRKYSGLDKRFFAHMEEIDFCWRLQLEGYRVTVIPDSLVYHLGGGTLQKNSPLKLKLNFRNNLLMLQNNLPKTFALELAAKGKSIQNAAEKGLSKARRRIFFRKCLDGICGVLYLCMGRPSSFKAVIQAHEEARKIGKMMSVQEIADYLGKHKDMKIVGFEGNVFLKFLSAKL